MSTFRRQIVFIRHAEKEKAGRHLSAEGALRARHLPGYLLHPAGEFEAPERAYVMTTPRGGSERCWETMERTIERGGMPYELVPRSHTGRMAAALLSGHARARGTVVVCWQHSRIVDMLTALGARQVSAWGLDPEAAGDDRECFDATWVVDVTDAEVRLRVFRQFEIGRDGHPHYLWPRNAALYDRVAPRITQNENENENERDGEMEGTDKMKKKQRRHCRWFFW